jgi:hypothetical protein
LNAGQARLEVGDALLEQLALINRGDALKREGAGPDRLAVELSALPGAIDDCHLAPDRPEIAEPEFLSLAEGLSVQKPDLLAVKTAS